MSGWGRTVALLVLAATVSACGARWSDAEHQLVHEGRTDRGPRPASSLGAAVGGSHSADPQPGALVGAPETAPAVGPGASAAPAAPEAALACAGPSTAPGVTDADLSVGAINSLSGPVAGLGASALAATRAYVAYRNATGGVCGRTLVLRDGDDGASGAQNRNLVRDLEPRVLGFVGGIAGGDSASVPLLEAEGVPVIGNSISPELRRSPIYYGVNMPLADPGAVSGKFRYLREQGVHRAAVVYSAPAVAEAKAQMVPLQVSGIEVVLELALPLATLSYDSAARAVANSRADYLLFIHEQNASAAMARSLAGARYEVRFPEYIVAYGSRFPELAGDAGEGATSWLYSLPAEDAGTNAELDLFLEWMGRTAPGVALDTFASVAWAAAKAFVETLEAMPTAISRPGLLAQASATPRYDADGLIAPVRFAERLSDGCLVGVVLRGGRWQRLTPAQGFLC